jgi:hypothetical protein
MKKVLIPLFVIHINCASQNTFPYQFSEQIENTFRDNIKESRFQNAAWKYCEIGNYLKAKVKLEEAYHSPKTELTLSDSNLIKEYSYFRARPMILKRAKESKLVMINEDHNDPKHRVFTESMLLELYNNGFQYLALEALEYLDKDINKRKFPILKSGSFIKEPQMANLIRTAIFIGYKLVAYESKKHKSPAEREMNQAKNIAKIFKKDPNAKVLVHCGHDHIYENEYPDWGKAMAGRIKELTSIDPLTINQQKYTEASTIDKSDAVLRKLRLLEPSVMINMQGQYFTTLDKTKQWDISLFHPFTKYKNGRPDWLTSGVAKLLKDIPSKPVELNYPYLVLAYLQNEFANEEAIPVDIVEIQNENDKKQLALYIGEYQLVMQDSTGRKNTQVFKVEYGK